MEGVSMFNGQLVYFMAIWFILWSFGIFSAVLVCCAKKNLATLLNQREKIHSLNYKADVGVSRENSLL
jgi:hypothetical protein